MSYRIKKGLYQRKAMKSYICEKCGCEIPKGDLYWEYKPLKKKIGNKTYFERWRKRCIDDKPYHYDEANYYENKDVVRLTPCKN